MAPIRTSIAVLAAALLTLAASTEAQTAPAVSSGCPASGPAVGKDGHFPVYLEDSFSQLKKEVPMLRALKFEGKPTPEQSAEVLTKTGAAIATMLPKIPSLVAKEELSQASVPLPYMVAGDAESTGSGSSRTRYSAPSMEATTKKVEGEDLHKALDGLLATPGNQTTFSYRIQKSTDPSGIVLDEFRTDEDGAGVDVRKTGPGTPRGIGFSNSWLLFVPANQKESHFRFLGKEKIDKRDTIVLAFAQDPSLVHMPASIGSRQGDCSFYMQGIVWIDETGSEILRLETDLLKPIDALKLKQLRSEIRFNEVQIKERALSFWLPSDLEITWETADHAGAELHKYSNYRLYAATSRLIVPK